MALCLIICAANVGVWAKEPSRFELETIAVWYEARGESMQVQQLVLDTIRNREKVSGKSLLEVLSQRGQFSWRNKIKVWRLTREQAIFGFKLREQTSPIRSDYLHFNDKPILYTKTNIKIGNLYFSEG